MNTINKALARYATALAIIFIGKASVVGQIFTNIAQLSFSAPVNMLVNTGQTVVISVTNIQTFAPTPRYQWLKDGIIIVNATNAGYAINLTSMDDVGTYSVLVSGSFARAESAPLNLGVYFLYSTNSNGGVLGVPIGQFTIGNNTLYCSGKSFDSYVVEYPFYGPSGNSQLPPFANTSSSTNLDISTCLTGNGPSLDTGILVTQDGTSPPTKVACSDDAGASCGGNSGLSMVTVRGLKTGGVYRSTIYYRQSSLEGLTSVSFLWYYHN
jgi:hypothetical protein